MRSLSIIDKTNLMNDTIVQNDNTGAVMNWMVDPIILSVITVLLTLVSIYLAYLSIKRERKKFINTFKGGKWVKSSLLSYNQFKEGRPESKYLHRQEIEKKIIKSIQNEEHIVLTGTSLRGKTRTMVECLKQLKKTSILLPYPGDYNSEIIFPKKYFFKRRKRIVVFDDLQKFFEPGKDPKKLIDKINENGWLIVSNCRTGEEWKNLQNIWGISLNVLQPIEIPEIDKTIAEQAAILNGKELPLHFDGKNMGTVFVNLDEMRLRYNSKITPVQKQILLAIKKLLAVGLYNFKGEINLNSIQTLTHLKQTDADWLIDIEYIIEKGFISGTPYNFIPEQVYFDLIVEPQLSFSEIIRDIRKAFPKENINYHKLIYTSENKQVASEIIHELKITGINPDIYQYNMLMAKQSNFKDGKILLAEMKNEEVEPNVITYSILINFCRNFKQGKVLLDQMKEEDIMPNVITYSTLINRCRVFDQGKALIEEMKNEKLEPNEFTYNSLIKICKDFEQGKALLAEMKDEKLQSNEVTYNTLISLCKDLKQGKELLTEMKDKKLKPDNFTYGALIKICENFDQGKELIADMKDEKLKPNVITYSTLMTICNDFQQGKNLLVEMEEQNLIPNVITYSILMNICDDFQQGKVLLVQMKDKNLQPNEITYNTLMKICTDFEQGKALLAEMKDKKLQPDKLFYLTLLKICNDYEQGKALLERMKDEKIRININIYSILIEYVITENDAISWIKDFCSTELKPNIRIRSGLEQIFPILYNSSRLMDIFAIIIRFNQPLFFSWFRNFRKIDIDKFILNYYKDVVCTDYNKLGFANYYIQEGELVSAKKLLDSVAKQNYPFYKYSGDLNLQMNQIEEAFENYEKALQVSEKTGHYVEIYNKLATLIKTTNSIDKIEDAIEYCIQSISYFPGGSPMSKQLLSYFTFEYCSIEEIPEKINTLKLNYNIGRKTFKIVLDQISNQKKKDIIYKLLN